MTNHEETLQENSDVLEGLSVTATLECHFAPFEGGR